MSKYDIMLGVNSIKVTKVKGANTYHLRIESIKEIRKVYDLMYNNATIFMKRKKQKLDDRALHVEDFLK